jgi:site-specific recombinase XerD
MTLARLEVESLLSSWGRGLRASAKSPRTVDSYTDSVRQFTAWCDANGRPVDPAGQTRADVQDFVAHLIDTRSVGTAGVRYRSLRQWFRWLAAEDEATDVMAGMTHPKLAASPVPVIADADLRALLEATQKARGFLERRDHAILRVLIDTGMRRGELADLVVHDLDLDTGVILVQRSKTGTGRLVPIGAKANAALDRYLRIRGKHRDAAKPNLWLGIHGPLTGEGVRQMLLTRCRQAGIPPIHPHQFRHTSAHRWLSLGGQEQDLARIAGWTPGSAMLGRYGASAAAERARVAHQRIAPGDSL